MATPTASSAVTTFAQAVLKMTESTWRSICNHNTDPETSFTLSHYSSLEGIKGIIDNGCLWATDARYLNDARELIETIEMLQYRIDRWSAEVGSSPGTDFAEDLLREVVESGVLYPRRGRFYVASLCADPDLLSMWRAYGERASSASITFAPGAIQTLLPEGITPPYPPSTPHATMKFIGRVVYNPGDQQSILDDYIHAIAPALGKLHAAHPAPLGPDARAAVMEAMRLPLGIIAVMSKNHGFREEREARYVWFADDEQEAARLGRPHAELFDRIGALGVTPYIKLIAYDPFGVAQSIPLDTLTLSPSANPTLAKAGMAGYLSRSPVASRSPAVDSSSIPLRW